MSDEPGPVAAVVVATRNRSGRLRALLKSLAEQDGPPFEVVVVDDGSTDDTAAAIAAADGSGLALRSVRHERPRGPAAARNAGWRTSNAPLLAFVDDDVVVAPGWLAGLVAAHRRAPGAIVQGRTLPHPAEVHRLSAFSRSQLVEGPSAFFQTCNIAYPRALLERLGGFDEVFDGPAGEDTDLGWRALALGARHEFEPGALALHAVHLPGALALARGAGRWMDTVRVVKRHPAIRREYRHRVFWKPAHELLLAAAAGALLARRTRGASLLAALPYVAHQTSQHGSLAGTLASLPAHALVDGAEVVAMLRASLRFRTLVL